MGWVIGLLVLIACVIIIGVIDLERGQERLWNLVCRASDMRREEHDALMFRLEMMTTLLSSMAPPVEPFNGFDFDYTPPEVAPDHTAPTAQLPQP